MNIGKKRSGLRMQDRHPLAGVQHILAGVSRETMPDGSPLPSSGYVEGTLANRLVQAWDQLCQGEFRHQLEATPMLPMIMTIARGNILSTPDADIRENLLRAREFIDKVLSP